MGSGYAFQIHTHLGAGAYICGEETALLSSLEGFRGQPRLKPPFPAVEGLYACPTVVNNTETLMAVPHIVKNGGAWYRQWGTEKSPGTKVFSVSGPVQRPGNYEVPLGYSMKRLIEQDCGGMRDGLALKAVIPGGSSVPLLPAADLAPKPRTLDHMHAAAVPLSALTAWQALFEHGDLEPGQRVLIHGAAGGVGGFAVQMARSRGAHMIATASPRHAESLRALGVNEIIDYTSVKFESAVSNVDLVFDTVGGQTQERSFQTLRRGGRLISIAAPPLPAKALEAGVDAMFFIVRPNRSQLIEIGKLIDAGKLKVAVQSVFPLSQTKEAFELAAAGHLRGKIVVQVAQCPPGP